MDAAVGGGVGAGIAVGGGTGVAVGVGGRTVIAVGRATNVAGTRASTVTAIATVGTAAGVSGAGCCFGAEELGTVGGEAVEPHPIISMASNVKSNAVTRYILAALIPSFWRITFE